MRPQLAVHQREGFQRETRRLNAKDSLDLGHVLRGSFVELYRLYVAIQLQALQEDGLEVHLAVVDRLLDFLSCLLTCLILAFDGNDDPVIQDVEDLRRLA